MRKLLLVSVAASLFALVTGCATPERWGSTAPAPSTPEASMLTEAVQMLQRGDSSGAARQLAVVCSGKQVPGVTDEALFRLALLSLRLRQEGIAAGEGARLLARLQKEYPSSPWTLQATPLMELIDRADDLDRQNRNLKASRRSLGAGRKELRQSNEQLLKANEQLTRTNEQLGRVNQQQKKEIEQLNMSLEQLKHLDLELEQKTR